MAMAATAPIRSDEDSRERRFTNIDETVKERRTPGTRHMATRAELIDVYR
jgi:hypothetical protein